MAYRGVVLAGGKGTRMGELTRVVNKHLLPVGTTPMIAHSVRKLIGAGVRDILLISGPEHLGQFIQFFGSGTRFGGAMTYRVQEEAGGIAQAVGLARDFCAEQRCVVLLGDNIFEDPLGPLLARAQQQPRHAWVALKQVHDPQRYGVAQLHDGKVIGIEEKPAKPKSDLAVVGIYVYPPDVFEMIPSLKPSGRGELEISDVNQAYSRQGRLDYSVLNGYWTDAGTLESLAHANALVTRTEPRM